MAQISESTIKTFSNQLTGLFDPNSSKQSRIESAFNIAQTALNEFFSACTDAQAEAKSKMSEEEKKSNNLNESVKTQTDANQKAINEQIDKINKNKVKIAEILKEIEGCEKEKQKISDDVKECQEKLEKLKEDYNNATTNEEKQDILSKISIVSGAMNELCSWAKELQNKTDGYNAQAENYQSQNDGLKDKADEIREEGEAKNAALNQQALQNQADATALGKKEVLYTAEGTRLTAEAMAIKAAGTTSSFFTFGFGGAASEVKYTQLMQQAKSNFAAAGIIGAGVPGVMSNIGTAFTGLNNNNGFLTNAFSTVGSLTAAANNDVDSFFNISNSVGSWLDGTESWEDKNTQLETAVDSAEEEIANEDDNSQDGDAGEDDKKLDFDTDYTVDVA